MLDVFSDDSTFSPLQYNFLFILQLTNVLIYHGIGIPVLVSRVLGFEEGCHYYQILLWLFLLVFRLYYNLYYIILTIHIIPAIFPLSPSLLSFKAMTSLFISCCYICACIIYDTLYIHIYIHYIILCLYSVSCIYIFFRPTFGWITNCYAFPQRRLFFYSQHFLVLQPFVQG